MHRKQWYYSGLLSHTCISMSSVEPFMVQFELLITLGATGKLGYGANSEHDKILS